MSLLTDIIFVKALRSNEELIGKLPAGDVYNTSIALPDVDFDNAPIPYVIVSFDGLQNDAITKDCSYEGSLDKVQISIEVAAQTRPQLGELVTAIRKTILSYFENLPDTDEDYSLLPLDYMFSSQGVMYYPDKPCYYQVLQYACDTNSNIYEQED